MDILAYDVEEIRRVAAVLRAKAGTAAETAAQIGAQPDGMTFEGPAANEFRTAVSGHKETLMRVAGSLESLAEFVTMEASRIEFFQQAERARQRAADPSGKNE